MVVIGLVGCADHRERATARDGSLVLELGGAQPALRAALQNAGVAVEAGHRLRPEAPVAPQVPVATVEPSPDPAPGPAPEPPVPSPASDQPPTPTPDADHFIVILGPRQTLTQLAKKHLGDGNRFRDILDCNGWTEAYSRRLQPGTRVKIPRLAAAPSPRR